MYLATLDLSLELWRVVPLEPTELDMDHYLELCEKARREDTNPPHPTECVRERKPKAWRAHRLDTAHTPHRLVELVCAIDYTPDQARRRARRLLHAEIKALRQKEVVELGEDGPL